MSMAEIAKLAGVSTATVCRVLNDSPLVREETAVQVRKVIERVGYYPQPARGRGKPRRDRGGRNAARNRRIAIITLGQVHQNWVAAPVIGSFVAGVTSAAREFDVDVMLDDMPDPMEPSRLVSRGEVGGAILLLDSSIMRSSVGVRSMEMLAHQLPIVWAMGGHIANVQVDHVLPDNIGIGHMAATYLAQRGCRKVAIVTTTPHWPLSRLRATMFACSAMDMGIDVITYLVTDDLRSSRAYPGRIKTVTTLNDAVTAMTNQDGKPDGLFIPRDYETARFYPILNQAELRPQRDIWVVSCDNDTSQLSLMDPVPATIDINTREVARRAIRRLRLRMRNDTEPPVVINVQPTLVEPHTPPESHALGRNGNGSADAKPLRYS